MYIFELVFFFLSFLDIYPRVKLLGNMVFWSMAVLKKTLESPLDWKEIKAVCHEENQLQIFNGKTDADSETPILWLPDAKSQLNGKDPDVGKDGRQGRRQWQRMRWLDSITDSVHVDMTNSRGWGRTGKPGMLWSMVSPKVRHDSDWIKMVVLFLVF